MTSNRSYDSTAACSSRRRGAPCNRPCRTSADGRRGSRASCGCGPGRPSPGWCSRCRVCADRRGSLGAVRLVGADLVRPGSRPAPTGAGHPDALQDRLELRTVVSLAGGHKQRQRLLPLLDRQVQFGGQPAARASEAVVVGFGVDAAGRLLLQCPFLRAPAACWWARATVESTETSQVINPSASAWACSCSKMRRQVPSRCQRRNRPYTVSHGPYRSGTSRQGAPARVRQRMPSINCRLVCTGGRPGFLPTGSKGSSFAHCAFVRSCRPTKWILTHQDPLLKRTLVAGWSGRGRQTYA